MSRDCPVKAPQKTADVLVVLHPIPIFATRSSDGVQPLRTRTVPEQLSVKDEPIVTKMMLVGMTHPRRRVGSNGETAVVEDSDPHRTSNHLELHV